MVRVLTLCLALEVPECKEIALRGRPDTVRTSKDPGSKDDVDPGTEFGTRIHTIFAAGQALCVED